jgi:hypothetical protein
MSMAIAKIFSESKAICFTVAVGAVPLRPAVPSLAAHESNYECNQYFSCAAQ